MDLLDTIEKHWIVITALVGFGIWLLRLEGKNDANAKRADIMDARVSHLEGQVDNIESGLTKELGEVKQALARIEGYLKAKSELTVNID